MRTKTQKETIDLLKARAKGETEIVDNMFLIDERGRIIGHGYWTPGAWFDWGKLQGTEITVEFGAKVKDIIADVRRAKNACKSETYNTECER
jgi:hypothetical protein